MTTPAIAGFAALFLIAVGALLYASAVISAMKKNAQHPLRKVADQQAEELTRKSQACQDGMSETDWLYHAALHLLKIWPGYPLSQALKDMRDYMPDVWGHPDYDWSLGAAEEMAEEYAADFGEEYGVNG